MKVRHPLPPSLNNFPPPSAHTAPPTTQRSTLTELATTSGADLNRAGSGSGGDAAQHTDSAEDISSSESDNSDSGSESDAEGETDPVERRTGDKDDVTAGGREG